jgi:hypothetical protein
MIVAARQTGIWAQSFGMSVLLHGSLVVYFLTPLLGFASLQPAPPEPMAVTLSVMDIAPETLDPATQDPAPETLPQPETLPPSVPEDIAPVAAEPETLAPVDPLAASALVAEPLTPVAPAAPEVIAPVATTQISPLLPDEDTLAALAPLGSGEVIGASSAIATPDPIAPVQSLPDPVVADPAPIATPTPPAEGTSGTPGQVDEFILRIRGQLALPCLVATPRRNPAGEVTLEMLAANEADIVSFANDLLQGVSPVPQKQSVLVDARQCAALNFVREGTRYPAYPLALGLETDKVASGGRLKGSLRNAAGRYVTLVLIDDNGVVQDLGGYLTFSGDTVNFDVPVTRAGAVRDTQQLLLAVATPGRPPELESMNGQLAQDFFAALRKSVARDAPLAMMPFRLQ